MSEKLIVLSGPTASGKSRLAIELAQRLDGEILNADSRLFYREMHLGTAKPTATEQAQVPHHLIDVASITSPWNVGDFVRAARAGIAEIQARGKKVIVCGGTGLYIRSLIEGLDEIPPVPAEIMTQLMTRLECEGLQSLFEELRQKDAALADQIGKTNTHRILRALGVHLHTGKSMRTFWTRHGEDEKNDAGYDAVSFFLDVPREVLTQRIGSRVDEMIHHGLFGEARALHQQYPGNPVLMKTIGYAEWLEAADEEIIIRAIKAHTRQFAKRQLTWWRKEKNVTWIAAEDLSEALNQIMQQD